MELYAKNIWMSITCIPTSPNPRVIAECLKFPIEQIESLRLLLRFRVPMGDCTYELEVLR
jgi:hypothetical protein